MGYVSVCSAWSAFEEEPFYYPPTVGLGKALLVAPIRPRARGETLCQAHIDWAGHNGTVVGNSYARDVVYLVTIPPLNWHREADQPLRLQ